MSRGYAGVVNIANDVIVYGRVMEKHEKFLFAVLDRWSEMRLTIDGDRCEFRMSKLTFFSHELTSNGLNPYKEKIAAIYI